MPAVRFFSIVFVLVLSAFSAQAQESKKDCDDTDRIYKVCGDQGKMLKEASDVAALKGKLVLITFGADWCAWCKSLNRIFSETEIWSQLDSSVVRLEIGAYMYDSGDKVQSGMDIANELLTLNKVESSVFNGVPFLAVVDPFTKKTVFIQTGELEDNSNGEGHDRAKVVAAILNAVQQVKK